MGKWVRKKGMQRGQLKRFSSSVVNAGKTANRLVIKEYASRASTLATPPSKASYSNNEEHYKKSRVLELSVEDLVLQKMRKLWISNFWQGYDHFHRVQMIDDTRRKLFFIFSGDRYFFVKEVCSLERPEEDGITVHGEKIQAVWTVERSHIYPTREIALRAFRTATLNWFDPRDLGQSILEKVVGPKLDLENYEVK